ncbi:carboxylic ester hydrolase-like isoform X2 [Panulirus ornatus]|uniref:carboxylic ester hydrolase-like isoform X2 n=1 Tax=Panulirus ornatus TaxID=150431 RepID=UPI003A848A7C
MVRATSVHHIGCASTIRRTSAAPGQRSPKMRGLLLVTAILAMLLTVALAVEEKEEEEAPVIVAEEEEDDVEFPVVTTSSGQVSGIREKSTKGNVFYSYHSIPYAQPPVGELRFKDPVMVESWEGVKDGSKMPPVCPQYSITAIITGKDDGVEGDEDCLFLNIFTPRIKPKNPLLPVMVFIHGGGYISGSTAEYPPHVLLNEDIILVTIQYRLGVLGFLSTEDKVAPGNLGLKDQTLALTWVQNNIFKFGGDPLQVTLFGESAGASSVHFQILSHRSLGLFSRVILQSGTALCPWSLGAAHAVVADAIGNVFNCSSEGGSEELITCLQAVNAKDLVPVLRHFNVWYQAPTLMGPRLDEDYLFAEPEFLMREARHKMLDLISGITEHEGAFLSAPTYANEALRSALKYNFVQNAPIALEFAAGDVSPLNQSVLIFDHYLKGLNLDAQHADNVTEMFTDRYFRVCHDLTTTLHAKNVKRADKKTYRYELRHRGQHSLTDLFSLDMGKHWVSHADDLFYLFSGGPLWKPLERQEDLELRDVITKLWANFAATGNPTPDDSLGFTWDPVTDNDFRYLALKPSPAMEEDYKNETREFWASLPLKQNLILHPDRVANITFLKEEELEAESTEAQGKEPAEKQDSKQTEGKASKKTESGDKKKDEL